MPTTVPPGFVADASLRVWVVTTIANTAAPTVAEINAGTTIDATCYLTNGFAPDAAVASTTRCTTRAFVSSSTTCSFVINPPANQAHPRLRRIGHSLKGLHIECNHCIEARRLIPAIDTVLRPLSGS